MAQYCPLCHAYLTRPELHRSEEYVSQSDGMIHQVCRSISPSVYVSPEEMDYVRRSILGEEVHDRYHPEA